MHYNSWVLVTECGFHICNSMQELKKSRRIVKSKMNLRLNNEPRVAALAIETSYFVLSNGMILELYNCHFILVFYDIVSILFSKWT